MPPYEQALGDWGKEKLPFNRRKLDFKSPNRHLCLPRPHTLVSMDVALRSIPELQRQDHITESTSNFALALIGGTCHGHWEERNATQIRPRPISTYFWRSSDGPRWWASRISITQLWEKWWPKLTAGSRGKKPQCSTSNITTPTSS